MDLDKGEMFSQPTMGSSQRHFVYQDYIVFGGMLLVSTFIGIFFAIKDRFSTGAGEFFTANGKLGVVPVALSMLASFLSSITLIGQPAEAFLFGSQLWYFGISSFLVVPIVGYVFAPFFQKKKYISAYQYFGERFSKNLQLLASVLFTIQMVLYLALVLYAPALAFHQVTGVSTMLIVSVMYTVCIFYTTVGGMKAVVWTDTFQVVVLYVALFAVLVKGTIDIGGFSVVWNTNAMYNRTDLFNWDLDPTVRYTTWSAFVGSAFLHIAFYGGNQLQIQRYLTVQTPAQARKMLWINTIGWSLVVLLTVYAGLLIFAFYGTCDPFKSNKITTADELFPLYVMETLQQLPGFPGLFLAGVFSAGLSTVSTGVNSLAAIWINELKSVLFTRDMWEKRSGLIAKILSFCFGVLSFLLVFLVPYLGGLAPVAISLSGIFTGSLFGIFCLGMFIPKANNTGATCGLLGSIAILLWMAAGSVIFSPPSKDSYLQLEIPVSGCQDYATLPTIPTQSNPSNSIITSFYMISFLWYPMLSCVLTVGIGYIVSLFTASMPRNTTPANGNLNSRVKDVDSVLLKDNEMQCVQPFLE